MNSIALLKLVLGLAMASVEVHSFYCADITLPNTICAKGKNKDGSFKRGECKRGGGEDMNTGV
jgi:hypothetical protein